MSIEHKFRQDLSKRHIIFIAIGAAIGTGLFLGSATALQQAGPSAIFAYVISGVAIFFMMRAMSEMALYVPHMRTFSSYAAHFINPFCGYVAGWSYILQMAFVCLADITAFATYMKFWYPHVSPWIWTLLLAAIICAINLSKVKIFGEMQFFLTLIKVAAIVIIIAGGSILIGKAVLTVPGYLDNIHKAFTLSYWFPYGWKGFVTCMAVVTYAFGGIEVVGISSAETKNPEKTLPKAINAIPIRIVLFYCMTLGILISLYPWQNIGTNGSPFVNICDALGFRYASDALNIIVLTAAASAINSDIYGSSRMIYSLAREGQALKCFDKLNSNGTPSYAIFVMLLVLVSGVAFNYYKHDGLFIMMADIAAIASIIGWILILAAQIFMRMKLSKEERKKLKFPMPLWPFGGLISIGFYIAVVIIMAYCNSRAFYYGVLWIIYLALTYNGFKYLDKNGRFVHKGKILDQTSNLAPKGQEA